MERRFTDSEVAEVLSAVAQAQDGGGKDGWTAEQVVAIASELGIDAGAVRSQLNVFDIDKIKASNTVETIPSDSVTIGAPRNVLIRRRIRGTVPESALEDAAEDIKRSFDGVTRLELKRDELVAVGKYPGTQATLYVESNPTHSVASLSLDYRKFARILHGVMLAIVILVPGTIVVDIVSSAYSFVIIMALLLSASILLGTGLVHLVVRQARLRAEKDFGLISHRLARSASAIEPSESGIETKAQAVESELSENYSS